MTNSELANALKVMLGYLEAEALYIGSLLIWQQNTVPYDVEVEYLESDGYQYIDTGIFINSSNFEIGYTAEGFCPWGWVHLNEGSGTWITVENQLDLGNFRWWYGNFNRSDVAGYLSGFYTIKYNFGEGITVNGVSRSFTGDMGTDGISTVSLKFFTRYDFNAHSVESGQDLACKFKSFYVKVDGVLVRDFIPVRIGQVGYMYDRVSKLLFSNSGTGNFTLGPDVEGNLSDYVLDGLIFHLDGIDKGIGSDWTDLIGGILTTYSGDTTKGYPTANSYYFGSGAGYLSSGATSLSEIGNITVEVCYKESSSMSNCFIFGFGGEADSGYPLLYKDNDYFTWRQGAYRYHVNNNEYTGTLTHSISINIDRGYHNGNLLSLDTETDYWDAHYGDIRVRIGCAESGGASGNPIRGDIYSIRIYNRNLTQAEQLLNQRVDNKRFNLGLSI